jgi:hypothetical protein
MKIRKQVYELKLDDVRRFPVWEFALDEEGEEGQDEATVRPCEISGPLDSADRPFIIRAGFTLADIGKHYVIPGIRESFYGKFAVNLGVLLPCVREAEWQKPAPDFVQEYYCTIRSRLSSLAFGTDRWFDLMPDTSTLATTLVQLFDRFGLPFFEQFPDYPAVLAYFEKHGDFPLQNSGRAALEAAIVAHHLGDVETAQRLFTQAHSTDHKGFRQHVSTLANRLGHRVA